MTEPHGRQFHVVERIGSGAYGSVFLAEQDSGAGFRRRVALKVLHSQHGDDKEAGRRMRDEARILGRLSHRNIVTVLDLVRLDGRWAVVMDYVPGADLERMIEILNEDGKVFPPSAALEIIAAVADALDAAYNATDGDQRLGVIHRDIKPSNVLLTKDGEVKVLDFGVARVNLDTREGKTGFRVGTERYMAPERIAGEGDTPGGDVYAVAASLAELLLGRPIGRTPVFPDKHREFVDATVDAVVEVLVDAPMDAVGELTALLRECLADEPESRPTSREVSDRCSALAPALGGESLRTFSRIALPLLADRLAMQREAVSGVILQEESSGRSGAAPTAAEPAPAPATTQTGTESTSERAAAYRWGALGAAVLLLFVTAAALASALTFAWQSGIGRADPEPPPAVATEPPPATGRVVVEPAAPAAVEPPAEPATDTPGQRQPEAPTASTGSAPATPEPAGAAAPAAATTEGVGPTVSRAMIVAKAASSITVTCGDVVARGSTSARITSFPAGVCTVTAVHLGDVLTAQATIEEARTVNCAVREGALTCD